MTSIVDHTQLHRTAKLFMDTGRAASHEEAMAILRGFRLNVLVGPEVERSPPHQKALLTLVNAGRRTFLGGIYVVGPTAGPLRVPLVEGRTLADGIRALGGQVAEVPAPMAPAAVIGTPSLPPPSPMAWRVTWEGWRGGVTPVRNGARLADDAVNPLAPVAAAAVCAGEVFTWYAGDHEMAGMRSPGVSLWGPGSPWLCADPSEPSLSYLPSRLWLIGLGNLGQAYSWLLACLPFEDASAVELLLQDFDDIAESNDSTSLLSSKSQIGSKKTRSVGAWLERIGFRTFFEERRFGVLTRRTVEEPGVALCGVDNALARADLDRAGFDLVVESGLGAGPDGFRNFSLHTFPGSRRSEQIWPRHTRTSSPDLSLPAYSALREAGIDDCGLAQIASRTVGVPHVGLLSAAFVIAELLRRLHGAPGLEVAAGSFSSLEDIEAVLVPFKPYVGSYVAAGREE